MLVVVLTIVTTAFAEPPQIYYTYPTPDDGATIIDPDVEIGAIITEPVLSDMKFTFQGTDYSFYDSSLVLMFNFDNVDGLGEDYQFQPELGVRDISLYGNDGILSDPPGIPIWAESAKYGGAFTFSGNGVDSGQSILVLHDDSLNPGSGDFAL